MRLEPLPENLQIPEIINTLWPWHSRVKIISAEGEFLTDKFAVMEFNTKTEEATYYEKERDGTGYKIKMGELKTAVFKNAKVELK